MGRREGDDNDGVWWRRPQRKGVDLTSDMQRGGGAQHGLADGGVLAPWILTAHVEASDNEPDLDRWCGAEATPYLVVMAGSIWR